MGRGNCIQPIPARRRVEGNYKGLGRWYPAKVSEAGPGPDFYTLIYDGATETRAELVPHVRLELSCAHPACSEGIHTTRFDCKHARWEADRWAGHCSEQPCEEHPQWNTK